MNGGRRLHRSSPVPSRYNGVDNNENCVINVMVMMVIWWWWWYNDGDDGYDDDGDDGDGDDDGDDIGLCSPKAICLLQRQRILRRWKCLDGIWGFLLRGNIFQHQIFHHKYLKFEFVICDLSFAFTFSPPLPGRLPPFPKARLARTKKVWESKC